MEKNEKIFVTEHDGMIGSAILRRLKEDGFTELITGSSTELDLTNQSMVSEFFTKERPDYVFLTSAMVGGILANTPYPAEFIYNNIASQTNTIPLVWGPKTEIKKLLFLGSSCIYPKDSRQPIKEEYLLSGQLEPTSEPYAIAKIAGIKMCQSYNHQYGIRCISVVPADVYGPGDDFNPETGHVLPALISKIHKAKNNDHPEVVIWGTGTPRREALHVDDLADACIFLMNNYDDSEMINIGTGEDITIKEAAYLISDVIGFKGTLTFDESKPDGAPQKLLDITKIRELGWAPGISLEKGVRQTCQWYANNARA